MKVAFHSQVRDLPTGAYTVLLRRGDWEQSAKATVRRNETAEANIAFACGRVRISSEPAGAAVSAGGKELGQTPLELPEQWPGPVSYTLKLTKHKPATVSGQVEAKKQLVLSAQLDKLPYPTLDGPYENGLGMKFVPVPGTEVLFGVWDVRVKDYRTYPQANSGVGGSWQNPEYQGQKVTPSEDCPVVNAS